MATTHMMIGGSTIELASLCPGSIKARKEKGDTTSSFAAKGTRIHSYVELIWTNTFGGRKLTKEDRDTIKSLSDDERRVGISVIEALKELVAKYGFRGEEIRIEEQFAFIPDVAGGTPDYFGFRAFGDFLMVDLKTGYNQVEPDENMQLLFYLCAILRNLDVMTAASFENFHLAIVQPNQDGVTVATKVWSTTREVLAEYDGRFEAIVQNVHANPDLRTPGDHCESHYCNVRATCPQRLAYENERSNGRLVTLMNGEAITDKPRGARLAEALRANVGLRKLASSIVKHCDEQEADAKELMRLVPDAVPGFMLTDSFGHRKWPDDKLVKAKAKELDLKSADISESKLISPAQMEKLCKIKKVDHTWIDALATKPTTGQTIVEGEAVSIENRFLAAMATA